jgi:DNA polymerase III delta subunit
MIVFLHGNDDYRRTREKQAVVEKFLKKHSPLGVKSFNCEEEGAIGKLKEFSRNTGLFDTQRLAVLESAWEAPEKELKELLESVKNSKTITALLSEHDAPKKEFAFLKKEPVIVKEFEVFKGAVWTKFVAAEAKERGVTLAPDAAQFLAGAYEGDSWRLATELERIAALGEKAISKKDLEALDVEIAPEFFALIRSLSYGTREARLAALERLFLTREPAAKIFNVLSGMVPGAAARFAAYDLAIKNGKLDYEEALADVALT